MSDDGLKVGGLMVLNESGWGDSRSIVTITRLTPTRVSIRYGTMDRQFVRRGGWRKEIGYAGMRGATLTDADDATIAEIREEQHRKAMIRRIEQVGWKKLTTAQLEAIVVALPAPSSGAPSEP